jgi:predicted XRE-type DNA-binding protein
MTTEETQLQTKQKLTQNIREWIERNTDKL